MILTCPACSTNYQVRDEALGRRSRKVRCAKCAHEWVIGQAAAADLDSTPVAPVARQAEPVAPEPKLSAAETAGGPVSAGKSFGTRAHKPRRRSRSIMDRLGSVALAIVVMAGILFAAWHYRAEIVRAWPATARLYAAAGVRVNVLGIEIRNAGWQITKQDDGTPVLTVNGELTNITGRGLVIPRLRLALRDDKARELYQWIVVLDLKRLNPGETARFTTSLPRPPPEAHDVQIRFEAGA